MTMTFSDIMLNNGEPIRCVWRWAPVEQEKEMPRNNPGPQRFGFPRPNLYGM